MSSRIHPTGPISNGVVRCYEHDLEAIKKTSRTAGNLNRQFFCCSKDMKDPDRCKFFLWADDTIIEKLDSPPLASMSRPSQRQRDAQARNFPSFSHPTPRKRSLSPKLDHSKNLSLIPSQKRLEMMKSVISEASGSPQISSVSPPKRKARSPPLPNPSRSAPRFSSSPTWKPGHVERTRPALSPFPALPANDIRPNDQLETMGNFDQGLFPSTPPSNAVVKEANTKPSFVISNNPTEFEDPKRPQAEDIQQDTDYEKGNESLGRGPLTPPRSSQRLGSNISSNSRLKISPGTAFKDEGRGTEQNAVTTQRQKIQNEQDSPFHKRATSLRTFSQSRPRDSSDSGSQDASLVKSQTEVSADSISALVQGLSTVPAYVRKLERKRVAAEMSNGAKTRKIDELEQELETLRMKNRALEETISIMQARRP